MEVLVTCKQYPYPLENGENLRIFHYVRALRDRHQFDLVCLGKTPPPEAIRPLFRRIIPITDPETVRPEGLARMVASFSVRQVIPPMPAFTRTIAEAIRETRYDVVWSSSDIVSSLPPLYGVPLLADIVDDMVTQYRRDLVRAKTPLDYARGVKRLQMVKAYERRYFRGADACLFVSEVDAGDFSSVCPGARAHVIANGVDADHFRPMDTPVEPGRLVFEGSMMFPPNADAAVHFVERILPLIRAVDPTVRLTLVGRDPLPSVRALASDGVEVTGFVDDVRPYIARAALFVAPLRSGAGIKNKVLQAWAMGKPVVATPESTGGLRADPDRNIVVRADPAEFAKAVLELLGDIDRRAAIGRAARETIERHYTWQAKAGELEALMQELSTRATSQAANA
jgi:glycosyltransferase involved in cell wall biosynthesis